MYACTCSSVAPCRTCSPILSRRSAANSAFESARLWFWHTRQRKLPARWRTRASSWRSRSDGAVAPALAPVPLNATRHSSATVQRTGNLSGWLTIESLMLQALDERHNHAIKRVAGQRPRLAVTHDPRPVDHEGLGHAIHAIVDTRLPAAIDNRGLIRIARHGEPLQRGLALILVVHAVNRRDPERGQVEQQRVFVPARLAPGR